MQYTFVTPPASRAADRPPQIDDAWIVAGRRVLLDAVGDAGRRGGPVRRVSRTPFAAPMASFCDEARRAGVPVEKLIIALKLAWTSLPELRRAFGETGPEVMGAAVTACIDAYFASSDPSRAD